MIIARNCGLLTDSMQLFDLTRSKENVALQLDAALEHSHYKQHLRIQEYNAKNQKWSQRLLQLCSTRRSNASPHLDPFAPFALILDGISVDQLIRSQQAPFVYAMRKATTVICSRMSPKQKSRVILLMKKEGLCCLAIGDGANDVSMIRESSVGVGVKGKEGNAAVNNADYIIRKFHHLIKLLFVHGRNNYRGNSYSVYLAFYENITFNIPLVALASRRLTLSSSSAGSRCSRDRRSIPPSSSPRSTSSPAPRLPPSDSSSRTSPSRRFSPTPRSTRSVLVSTFPRFHVGDKMFSGRRMWSYLLGAFVNAVVCSCIPLVIFSETQTIRGGRQERCLGGRNPAGAVEPGILRVDQCNI